MLRPTLRPATPEDAPALAEIWHGAWHAGHAGHVPQELVVVRTPASFRERVDGLLPRTTVAVLDGGLAGFATVAGDEVELLFVDAPYRGMGVAEVLLDDAERRVAAAGHHTACLSVVTGNARARRFYERRGWTDDGELPESVEVAGTMYVVPGHRYLKELDRAAASSHDGPALRPATPDDAAPVADLWHRGWHDAHPGHVPDGLTAARTLEAFHQRTPSRMGDTTVAEVDGRIAGFIMIADDEVEQLFVHTRHRGTSVARVLLDEAERQVAAAGYDEAWLAVVAGNARARRFYERHGWRDRGDLPYEVVAGGTTYISPCRRYVKALRRDDAGALP